MSDVNLVNGTTYVIRQHAESFRICIHGQHLFLLVSDESALSKWSVRYRPIFALQNIRIFFMILVANYTLGRPAIRDSKQDRITLKSICVRQLDFFEEKNSSGRHVI